MSRFRVVCKSAPNPILVRFESLFLILKADGPSRLETALHRSDYGHAGGAPNDKILRECPSKP